MKFLFAFVTGMAALFSSAAHAQDKSSSTPEQNLVVYEADCAKNILPACNNAGASYGSGRGTDKSVAKAQQFYSKACSAGYGESCMNIGLMHLNPKELGNKPVKAREWIEKGCDLGSVNSCATYSTMLRAGMGGAVDFPKARKISLKACNDGAKIACDNLGLLALQGKGGEQDYNLALKAFDAACRQSFGQSCNNIASMFASGQGIEADQKKANSIFERSCKTGYDVGCKNYAIHSVEQNMAITTDGYNGQQLLMVGEGLAEKGKQQDSFKMFGQACNKNSGLACRYIGISHLNGLHGKKDRAKAQTAFEKACGLRDTLSCLNVAQMKNGKL